MPRTDHTAAVSAATEARWITRWADTAAFAADWNRLATGLFTRHEWFDAAWAWAGQSAELRVLAVWSGGRLIGVLPACLTRHGARRELGLITVPDTQFADLLLAPGAEADAAGAMADALLAARGAWDELRLTRLPADGAWRHLAAALAGRTATATGCYARNLAIALDAPWAPFYASLSKTVREKNQLAANRLARAGAVSTQWERGAAAAALLPEVAAISAASWKRETGLSLDQPGPAAFLARLGEHGAAQGWLSVWLARLDGQAVAMELQLIDQGQVYALRSDFRAELGQVSPGTWLNWKLLERLSGEGLARYYMGPGENAYKLRWSRSGAELQAFTAWSPSLRGRVWRLWDTQIKPAARRLRARWRNAAEKAE